MKQVCKRIAALLCAALLTAFPFPVHAEEEAQKFISQFADAREIKPEFISITDIRSDEDVE